MERRRWSFVLAMGFIGLSGVFAHAQLSPPQPPTGQQPTFQPPRLTVPKPTLTLPPFYMSVDPSPTYPFILVGMRFVLQNFPSTQLDPDDVIIGGTCKFVKSTGLNYGAVQRKPDGSIEFTLQGWFEKAGQGIVTARIPAGGQTIRDTVSFRVATPTVYTFSNTADLSQRLLPTLETSGIGSDCARTESPVTGVTTVNSDLAFIVRGGALDQHCFFKTVQWVLPFGVRLKQMKWVGNKVGNRCDQARFVSSTLPAVEFALTRGTEEVRPDLDQPVTDFFVFSDGDLVVDGVKMVSALPRRTPRTMVKACSIDLRCVSMAVLLTDSEGTHGPTTDPQSFAVILDRVVFEGPPGLLAELKNP